MKNRRVDWVVFAAVAGVVAVLSCELLSPGGTRSPYEVGRTLTVAYLIGESHLDPETRNAVAELYSALGRVVSDAPEGEFDVRRFVSDELAEHVQDPSLRIAALVIFDRYWKSAQQSIGDRAATVLEIASDLHCGISDALRDYGGATDAPSTE